MTDSTHRVRFVTGREFAAVMADDTLDPADLWTTTNLCEDGQRPVTDGGYPDDTEAGCEGGE